MHIPLETISSLSEIFYRVVDDLGDNWPGWLKWDA